MGQEQDRSRPSGLPGVEREAAGSPDERRRLEAERDRAVDLLEHGDAMLVLDSEFRYVLVNEAQERSSGRRREETLGRRIWDVWPEAADPKLKFWDAYHRVMAERVPLQFEEYFAPLDLWVEVRVSPTAEGGIAVFFRGINERKRAEEERDRLATQLRLALDAARMGWWHYDPATRKATFDERYTEIFGVTGRERPNEEILKLLHPQDLPRVWAAVEAALDPADPLPYSCEYRVLRPDGQLRWVEAHGVAVFEGAGAARRAVSFVGTVADVTARRRADEELRASEARLRAFVQSDVIGILFGDVDGRVYDCNEELARIIGRPREEVLAGKVRWTEITPEEDLPLDAAALAEARASGRCRPYEKHYRRPDGTKVPVQVGYVLLEPERRRSVAFILDITERKAAEAALRDSDRRKTEFLGVLSHELRNPLAPILNGIYVLERSAPDSAPAHRAKQAIRRQTEHLTRLIDDLLDVTRISRGKITLQRARLDLRDLVRRTADDLRSLFELSRVELRVDLGVEPIWVEADATRMAQVVGNLLQNSVKFTPAGGVVIARVAARGDRAEVSVRDDGIGIPPGAIERMFEPFAQAEQGLARTKGGLGLGLALVRGLVELHDGSVEGRSDGLGRGAEFLVRLPRVEGGASEPREPPVPARAGRRSILVIEDNPDAAQSLGDILELRGDRVHVATDGRSGIELARRVRPDVVVCDLGLPDLDGYDVARTIRSDAALAGTRLIALSGYAQPEDRQRARGAGFDAHVAKPADIDELLALLDRP